MLVLKSISSRLAIRTSTPTGRYALAAAAVARQRRAGCPARGCRPCRPGGPRACRRPGRRPGTEKGAPRDPCVARSWLSALVVVAHLHLGDHVVRHRERQEPVAADRGADLDPRARAVPREREPDRAEERRQVALLHADVRPVAAPAEMSSPVVWMKHGFRLRRRAAAVGVVGVVVVVRVVRVDDDVEVPLVRDLGVPERGREAAGAVVRRLGVAGVLARRVGDRCTGRRAQSGVARLDAGLPVRRVLDVPAANAAASARFWSWRLCVYQFPTSTTSAVEQQEHRDHHGGHDEHAAALVAASRLMCTSRRRRR